jgi:ectoine hydroxylase-related dioxygenase (phytanoyl-CoA dioxygenase family)
MCNTLWLIDDMSAENGATRLVPGSYLNELEPGQELDGDPTKTHPREIKIEGKAGQVVVFNGRTWHGGTQRTGGGPRRLLIGPFSVRSMYRDQPLHVGPDTAARLTPAQRWLLHLDDSTLSSAEQAYAVSA